MRIVGLVGRGEAIVEANETGRARLEANPRLTVGDAPMKTLPDVPLRAGELTFHEGVIGGAWPRVLS